MTTPTPAPPPPGGLRPDRPAPPADPFAAGWGVQPWRSNRHELPPPSKAMAGWALGLAIVTCWGIGSLISIGLAIVVLVRCQDGRNHGKGLAISALIINGVWLLVAVGLVVSGVLAEWSQLNAEPERDESGQVTDSQNVMPAKLRVGDCFNDSVLAASGPDEGPTESLTVTVLQCDRGHDFEVYRVFTIPGPDYPGDASVERQAGEGCLTTFKDFVGRPYARSELEPYLYYPMKRTWELLDDHGVTCVVGEPGRRTYGTLENSRR